MKRTDRIGLIPQGLAAMESEAIDYTELRKILSLDIGSSALSDVVPDDIDDDITNS